MKPDLAFRHIGKTHQSTPDQILPKSLPAPNARMTGKNVQQNDYERLTASC